MAERVLTLQLRFHYSKRQAAAFLAALIMVWYAPELGSENVVLTTYYPAPSGVYTRMITTGDTYLARDGGRVYLGTTAGTSKLNVNGATSITGSLTVSGGGVFGTAWIPSYANWNSYGTGSGGAAIYNDSGGYQTLMVVGNNSGGGFRRVGVWDELTVNGSGIATSNMVAKQNACYTTSTSYGGGAGTTSPVCAGGYYATLADGFMGKVTIVAESQNADVTLRCCPCPSGGCPSF